jgi:hypothetical protein
MNKDQIEQLEQEVDIANQGRLVLNNVAFKQAFARRQAELFAVFTESRHDEPEIREEAWRTMQNLTALEDYFRDILTTGKMASDDLKSNPAKD